MFHVKRARGEDEQDPREAGEPPGLAWGNPTAPAREKPTGPASRGYNPAPAGVAGAFCPVTPMPEVDLPRPGDRSRRTVARARASAGPAPGRGGTPALGWREGPRPSGAAPWAHRKARARRTGCSGDGYGLPDRGRLGEFQRPPATIGCVPPRRRSAGRRQAPVTIGLSPTAGSAGDVHQTPVTILLTDEREAQDGREPLAGPASGS